MTDLNELLKDWKSKRLAYNEISRNSLEALFTGIVDELEALKRGRDPTDFPLPDGRIAMPVHPEMLEHLKAKRGPGRPPKAETA